MKRRLICAVCTFVLLLGIFNITAYAKTSEEADRHLQFNEDGKFTVMQISDIQDGPFMKAPTEALIRAALREHPCDLIVLTGDNIASTSGTAGIAALAINRFMSIFEEAGIPVAMTFGNHDAERTRATKERQLKMYEQYDCFIGCAGEELGDTNLCTYYVPIYASDDANEPIDLVWMVDSGAYNTENELDGYAATTKAQVDWYTETSQRLEEQYGRKIPGLMFQHIVVPEIWDALVPGDPSQPGGWWKDDVYYVLPEGSKGVMGEPPSPPKYTNGQFDAVAERGDILAMFFGHDHVNTYEVYDHRGVDLINTPGIGFNTYNSEVIGFRMIYLDENDPWSYETEVYSYFDVFDYDDDLARYLYKSASSTVDHKTHFAAYFKSVFAFIERLLGNVLKLGCPDPLFR